MRASASLAFIDERAIVASHAARSQARRDETQWWPMKRARIDARRVATKSTFRADGFGNGGREYRGAPIGLHFVAAVAAAPRSLQFAERRNTVRASRRGPCLRFMCDRTAWHREKYPSNLDAHAGQYAHAAVGSRGDDVPASYPILEPS